MDQELISYFDQRFREMSLQNEAQHRETRQEIAGLRKEMNERFEQVETRIVRIEIRLDQIEERVEKVETRLGQVAERIREVDDRVHLTQISVEDLRSDLRMIAEGVMSNDEKIITLREEVSRMLNEMGVTIRQTYQDMGDRVRRVERFVKREGRDPVELVREKFGKPAGNS